MIPTPFPRGIVSVLDFYAFLSPAGEQKIRLLSVGEAVLTWLLFPEAANGNECPASWPELPRPSLLGSDIRGLHRFPRVEKRLNARQNRD
jgi:hypothetical protein